MIPESLAAGCPVLISDQTPWTEQIHQHSAGWAYPISEERLFKEKIEEKEKKTVSLKELSGAWEDTRDSDEINQRNGKKAKSEKAVMAKFGTSKNNDWTRYGIYAAISLILALVQFNYMNLIDVNGVHPDLPLIFCVWIAIREGRFTGIIAAFLIGIAVDFVSFDLIVAGSFHEEGKEMSIIRSTKFLLIVFLSSLIHNLIYYFLYIKPSEISFLSFFLKYGLAFSFYTTVFAIFPMLIRRKERLI